MHIHNKPNYVLYLNSLAEHVAKLVRLYVLILYSWNVI